MKNHITVKNLSNGRTVTVNALEISGVVC